MVFSTPVFLLMCVVLGTIPGYGKTLRSKNVGMQNISSPDPQLTPKNVLISESEGARQTQEESVKIVEDSARGNITRQQLQLRWKLYNWANHIKRYIRSINCKSNNGWLSSRERCESVQFTPFEDMILYIAPPAINRVYSVVSPDGELDDPTHHHAVAVVDPFPEANFGHLVFVFYIDGSTKLWCDRNSHHYIGSGFCLIHSRKSRCLNARRANVSTRHRFQKCEVNFIPLVFDHYRGDEGHGKTQELLCLPNFAGFGPCPKALQTTPNIEERCELRENTKDCYMRVAESADGPRAPMHRLYEICDQAVAIFGGWNAVTMRKRNEENMKSIYNMFRRNGFLQRNIQIFYNGNGQVELQGNYNRGLPASDKAAIRHHIQNLCAAERCVDSLVIYMNGPATTEGDLLLWDKNGNGLADEGESYTVEEVLSDITGCSANQVILMIDQCYSGVLANALSTRRNNRARLENIVLLASSGAEEYSWDRGATAQWGNHPIMRSISWGLDGLGAIDSTPSLTNQQLAKRYTIYGAPIVRGFPIYARNYEQLRQSFMGCQNLPTARCLTSHSP